MSNSARTATRSGLTQWEGSERTGDGSGRGSRRALAVGAALVAAAVALACASNPPVPRDELALARTAISQAEQAGAQRLAVVELERAQYKLREAQDAIDDEDYWEASRLAEESFVDAQLAEALADAKKTRNDVETMQRTIQALREEAGTSPRMPAVSAPPPQHQQPGQQQQRPQQQQMQQQPMQEQPMQQQAPQ